MAGVADNQIDPIQCPLKHILDYLAHLYENNFEYRSINNHRSAISAYHCEIDGFKTGQHPKVTALLKGVANERPPRPKHNMIWDVEQVLVTLREFPSYKVMSYKQMTLKVTTLLAITSISRRSKLKHLDVKFMEKQNGIYQFQFKNRVKHSRMGKIPPPVIFLPFPRDARVCPVVAIDNYLEMTKSWRTHSTESQFFLCHRTPHKPASKATITRWVKESLTLSGINIAYS